jgi:hypothetical protein
VTIDTTFKNKVIEEFNKHISAYEGSNPTLRPRIPKIHTNQTANNIIRTLNHILSETVLENSDTKIYWDREIVTDQTINCNRPDIVLIKQNNKTAFFIDITHPADHNITKAESEKIAKYNDLTIEFKDIYKLKSVETIPISATGLITKNLSKFLSKLELPSDRICSLMQKSVILETCRITRKVLNIKE